MAVTVLETQTLVFVHREDVKAELCKRYGSLKAAAPELGVGVNQLRDYLFNKSKFAHDAVSAELGIDPKDLRIVSGIIPKCGGKKSADQGEAA